VNDAEAQTMRRENDYLKRRCAQLQQDVTDLESQLARLQQERDRLGLARAQARPNPLSGGQ
jgi:hypothetical protein